MYDRPRAPNSTCFNLAEVFGTTNTSVRQAWSYNVNKDTFDPNATYTSITYRQLSEANPKVGEEADRLVKFFMLDDCSESAYYSWHGFSCQDAGSFYTLPRGIRSFSVLDREQYNYEDQGHCWVNAELGSSAASTNFKGCLAAVMAASVAGMLLTM